MDVRVWRPHRRAWLARHSLREPIMRRPASSRYKWAPPPSSSCNCSQNPPLSIILAVCIPAAFFYPSPDRGQTSPLSTASTRAHPHTYTYPPTHTHTHKPRRTRIQNVRPRTRHRPDRPYRQQHPLVRFVRLPSPQGIRVKPPGATAEAAAAADPAATESRGMGA